MPWLFAEEYSIPLVDAVKKCLTSSVAVDCQAWIYKACLFELG
jgi:hypothetical protein